MDVEFLQFVFDHEQTLDKTRIEIVRKIAKLLVYQKVKNMSSVLLKMLNFALKNSESEFIVDKMTFNLENSQVANLISEAP